MESVGRFFRAPQASFFLFGPRGTGKSTWLRKSYSAAIWIDLLDPETFRRFKARPERLLEIVRAQPDQEVVVLDEIQKVPELLNPVHQLVEEESQRRFVLTGSSARKLRRAGVNLLAGRAVVRSMHPFMAAELGDRFALDEALRQGLVPLVVSATDPVDTLRSYASLYVKEEVQAEGLVRNVGDFARFLEAISFSQATPLNISNVARDCQVERKTVAGYLGILEDLLLGVRVPVFTRRAKRVTTVHPKFYFFDCGVFRSLRPAGSLDRPEEIEGAALEGLVLQHLRAWNEYGETERSISFWRTRAGSEVDFVVYGPNDFWGLEVKNSARVRSRDLRPLQTFLEDYPQAKGLLLYRGAERLRKGDVLCVPVVEFLRQLRPGSQLWDTDSTG